MCYMQEIIGWKKGVYEHIGEIDATLLDRWRGIHFPMAAKTVVVVASCRIAATNRHPICFGSNVLRSTLDVPPLSGTAHAISLSPLPSQSATSVFLSSALVTRERSQPIRNE
jgi:hypothetical protein